MKKITRTVLVLFFLFSILGLGYFYVQGKAQQRIAEEARIVPDGVGSYEQFKKKVQKYPYVASVARARQIKQGLKNVERCMTKAQIRALMGEPDFGDVGYGPKGPGEKWIGSSWMFFLSQRQDSVNLNDATVQVFFDRADRAVWVVPSNVEIAKVIGNFDTKCSRASVGTRAPEHPAAPPDELKQR